MWPILSYVITQAIIYVVPFLAFFSGVWVSSKLRQDQTSSRIWLRSIPTSVVVVGFAMTSYAIPNDQNAFGYAFAASFHQFLIFVGFLMFSGTVADDLFSRFQQQVKDGKEVRPPPEKAPASARENK